MVSSVSAIIVSYRARAHVLRAVWSAADAEQVLVVDNASQDGTAEAVSREAPFATLLMQADNVGFGRAVNVGLQRASGEFVLLLNSDAELPAGGVSALVAAYRRAEARHGRIGALAMRQVDAHGQVQLVVGPEPTPANEALRSLWQRSLDRRGKAAAGLAAWALDKQLRRPRLVPWASASCMMLRRSDLLLVGGFDPAYFLYFEDVDLCLRLRRAGLPVAYAPEVTVVHARGESARQAPALSCRAYRHGQVVFARRWRHPLVAHATAHFSHLRARGT